VGVKTLLLALLLALPAAAQWQRLVITQKDLWTDRPEPHALDYFTKYPLLRDESGDFCYLCSSEKRLEEARKAKARAEVRVVGKLNGNTAYDVFYYFEDEQKPAWKSIIIQTGPDSYREIYHDQPNEGEPVPSFIVSAGNDPLVCVLDNVYRLDAEDDCFWPEANGIVRLDFKPAWDAAQRVVPSGSKVWPYGIRAKSTFEQFVLKVRIISQGIHRCCDLRGLADVRFKLERGRVVVLQATFDPDGEY